MDCHTIAQAPLHKQSPSSALLIDFLNNNNNYLILNCTSTCLSDKAIGYMLCISCGGEHTKVSALKNYKGPVVSCLALFLSNCKCIGW